MFKDHPRGLIPAALSNMGERFGYYIMNAVLVLFLCSKFGLSDETSGSIYSCFYAGIYILSLVLGFLLALIQIQKIPVLKQLARVYIWVFRGTPLIVQMYIIFFGLPSLGVTLDAFPSAVIAFSLNYAAYMSETIRAAIQSVPEGQWEAGYMIGLSSGQIMLRVILPQAARVAFPTLFSTLIGLTKDSSLAASITVVEMFKAAQQIASRTFEPFALYCEAAFVYLMLNTVLTLLQSVLEKRLAWKQPKQKPAQKQLEKEPACYVHHQ